MASWPAQRAQFVQQFTAISNYVQNQMPTDIQNLTTAMSNYVQAGGVSNDPSQDPNYATIVSTSQNIQTNQAAMMSLNKEVTAAIRNNASDNDINGLLSENGLLQQGIQDSLKRKQDTEADAKAAELRDELLRTREHKISRHQLFLLGRPLRPASIPYLWALSALFIGIALIGLAMTFPSLSMGDQFEGFSFAETMSKPLVWGTLLLGVCVTVLFLILNAVGVFKA